MKLTKHQLKEIIKKELFNILYEEEEQEEEEDFPWIPPSKRREPPEQDRRIPLRIRIPPRDPEREKRPVPSFGRKPYERSLHHDDTDIFRVPKRDDKKYESIREQLRKIIRRKYFGESQK